MKSYRWIILGVIACLVFAVAAYFWATGLLDSIYNYRSPLHNQPLAAGEALGKPITRRVVFVLIDALRADTSLKPEVMPFLNELRQKGASATMHSRPPSYSEPGYSVLLTGAWPDLSDGPTINLDYADIPTFTQDDLFSAAHRVGLKTGISGYYWFEKLVPQAAVNDHFYTPLEDRTADRQVTDAVLPWLKAGADQLTLIHLDQVDYAGHHEGGPRDPRWDQAARRADDLLREITATLDLSQDTLFICSDHGQIDRGGHGGQDAITLVEPWVLVGAGIKPGEYGSVNMVDVAPTLAALLGTNLPATTQGRVHTEMLELTPAQTKTVHTAFEIQQKQLLDAYQAAINSRSDFVAGKDRLAAYQNTLQNARAARLKAERFPRGVLAVVLGLIPLAVLAYLAFARKQARAIAWLLAGAVVYLLLFNFRYAILDGRTYSLSSVTGATDLILYCATTAAISLLVGWLVSLLGMGAFRQGPKQAAGLTLGLALVTGYLLLLPALWSYMLNGALVTWTLPDFASAFLAFLSLIQILMVAVLSILFAGLGALAARFSARPSEARAS